MDKQKQQPSKESVRNWLRTEIAQRRPPPDPAQIRRELGWDLITGEATGSDLDSGEKEQRGQACREVLHIP